MKSNSRKHGIVIPLFASLLLLLASACSGGGTTAAQRLAEADSLIQVSHYDDAQRICDELYGDTASLTPAELGELSLVYISLADADENSDPTENIAAATECFMRAYTLDPDSAAAFYSSLTTPARQRMAATLMFFANPGYGLPDLADDEPSDSIGQ
ncbi:MAG: hypothetical protein NC336_09735 [Clostridium sp.]|nr:hypothetical protein [Clostridium sp.]